MAVVPGFYGSKFIPQVLDKIKAFKREYPTKEIGIDGGIKLNNVKDAKKLGIKYIYVGSAILNAPSPKEAYQRFVEEVGK